MPAPMPRRVPPGPPGRLLGPLLQARRDPIAFLQRMHAEHGDLASFTFLGAGGRIFFATHPDLVHEVLVTQHKAFKKGKGLEDAKRLLGEGLLTSEGEFHRRQRRMMQPLFDHRHIARYAQVMVEHAARTRDRWREGQRVDMAAEMSRLTLAVVGRTLFDADVEGEAGEVGQALRDSLDVFDRVTNPFAGLMDRLPLPSTRRFQAARGTLDRVVYGMIDERRAKGATGDDLLSLLLAAEDAEEGTGAMTREQVRDEALTLFLAGHETTALAMTWTWYLLSQNPAAEARFHQELDEVLGGATPAPEDFPRLPYTRMVLSESMRLYPPAWSLGRRALQDLTLGGYDVQAGDRVLLSQFITHRDARWWPEPERFDPERFAPLAVAQRHRHAYFPFGGGPRVCIGEGFAWMEGVLLLATLGQRWRPRLAPDAQVALQPLITLRPRHGMAMVLEGRGGAAKR